MASVIVSSVPFSASAESLMEEGNIDGYDYELYNQNCSGEFTMEPKAGSFIISWKDIELCMASIGKKYDLLQKNGKDMENVSFSYDLDFSPCGNAYFGAYGGTQNPDMEFYIVEGWNEWEPPSISKNLLAGTVVINGNEYDVFQTYRIYQPGIDAMPSIPQYWSVRKETLYRIILMTT
ncbi:glycoside hydrolase family 11 protein [Ruminococcus sp.]